jgi:uncharacterized membrane protein
MKLAEKNPDESQAVAQNTESTVDTNDSRDKKIVGVKMVQQFSGPLPPPELLKSYDGIVKNGAERIFVMTEKQVQHRINMEDKIVNEELIQSSRGQIIGAILVLIALSLSVFLALRGHDLVASVIGGTTLIGLATVFVKGKIETNKDNDSNPKDVKNS